MNVAVTGHRPPHDFKLAKRALNNFFKIASNNSITLLSGMADGWDTICARAALHYEVPLHCYVPFKGQNPTSEFYGEILDRAEKVVYCADAYHKRVFLDRDDRLVEAGELFLAFLSPTTKGGTYYTVRKAKEAGKPVINFYV